MSVFKGSTIQPAKIAFFWHSLALFQCKIMSFFTLFQHKLGIFYTFPIFWSAQRRHDMASLQYIYKQQVRILSHHPVLPRHTCRQDLSTCPRAAVGARAHPHPALYCTPKVGR